MNLATIILAAGKGTRMQSDLPKVLHKVAGKSMINHVVDTASKLTPAKQIVVKSDDAELPVEAEFIVQKERLGTGHAVKICANALKNFKGKVLTLYGDVPLIAPHTLQQLLEVANKAQITVLGFNTPQPTGYGRLVTQGPTVTQIVEEKDATDEQKRITMCNSGIFVVDAELLFKLLEQVTNNNAQGEYYLTDIVSIAAAQGITTNYALANEGELQGVNSKAQLAAVEYLMQHRLRMQALDTGVTMQNPQTVYLQADTKFGKNVELEPNIYFGSNVTVGDNVTIKAFSHIDGATIGSNAVIGPFARLRPGSDLASDTKIGNFVEVKNAKLGQGSKVNHLSYVGDADVGKDVNIGAGSITCNYDGFKKHKTNIGDNVFIGSNSAMVAPVNIAQGTIVAAGSTLTSDTKKDDLAIARSKQVNKAGLAKKFRDKSTG